MLVGEGGQGLRQSIPAAAFGFGGKAFKEGGAGGGLTAVFSDKVSALRLSQGRALHWSEQASGGGRGGAVV